MRDAFSMLELVFVIVIIGILSAIAIPKFSITRTDAQSISIQSDITLAISSIQREIFVNNLAPQDINIQWLFKTAGLNPSRWIIQNNRILLAQNRTADEKNNCIALELNANKNLVMHFTPKVDSAICTKLASFYQDESKEFPLFTH